MLFFNIDLEISRDNYIDRQNVLEIVEKKNNILFFCDIVYVFKVYI